MIFARQKWMDYAIVVNGRYVLKEDVPKFIKEEYEEYQKILNDQFKDVVVKD